MSNQTLSWYLSHFICLYQRKHILVLIKQDFWETQHTKNKPRNPSSITLIILQFLSKVTDFSWDYLEMAEVSKILKTTIKLCLLGWHTSEDDTIWFLMIFFLLPWFIPEESKLKLHYFCLSRLPASDSLERIIILPKSQTR